jgi:tetratricopeptide (TPR) repeat protein
MRLKILLSSILLAAFLAVSFDVAAQKRPPITATTARSITIVTKPKAAVWLDDVRRGITDDKGLLKIEKLVAGTRRLRVRAVGFAEKTQTLAPTARGEVKIELMPIDDEAELAFQQAEVARESGKEADKKRAAELYRRALQLRPRFAEAHVGLARLLETADFDAALEQIEEARKDRPAMAEASTVEGRIYRENNDYENAVKSFKRAIREAKNFQPEAHTGLALAYKDGSNFAAAIGEFKIAIAQLADSEPVLYQLLGETYEQMGRKQEAVATYEKFLQLAPNSNQASAVRSIIEQLKKQEKGDVVDLMPQ